MRRFLRIVFLLCTICMPHIAQAKTGIPIPGSGRYQYLSFVADTKLQSTPGSYYSLCALITKHPLIFNIGLFSSVSEGYKLSDDRCMGTRYRDLDNEKFKTMKTIGIIDASVSESPSLSFSDIVSGYFFWFLIGGIIIYITFINFKKSSKNASTISSEKTRKQLLTDVISSLNNYQQAALLYTTHLAKLKGGNISEKTISMLKLINSNQFNIPIETVESALPLIAKGDEDANLRPWALSMDKAEKIVRSMIIIGFGLEERSDEHVAFISKACGLMNLSAEKMNEILQSGND